MVSANLVLTMRRFRPCEGHFSLGSGSCLGGSFPPFFQDLPLVDVSDISIFCLCSGGSGGGIFFVREEVGGEVGGAQGSEGCRWAGGQIFLLLESGMPTK